MLFLKVCEIKRAWKSHFTKL